MTILTAAELELLERLIANYEDRAQRFDSMHNRPMAERQKAIELEKVALLKKLKEIVENPPRGCNVGMKTHATSPRMNQGTLWSVCCVERGPH